jgi:hypothetical protein
VRAWSRKGNKEWRMEKIFVVGSAKDKGIVGLRVELLGLQRG